MTFLASKNSDEPVANFAEIIDKLNKKPEIVDILNFELIPAELTLETKTYGYNDSLSLIKDTFFKQVGNIITEYQISLDTDYDYKDKVRQYRVKGYSITSGDRIDVSNKQIQRKEREYSYNYYSNKGNQNFSQKEDLQKMGLCDLFITMQDGRKIQINHLKEI